MPTHIHMTNLDYNNHVNYDLILESSVLTLEFGNFDDIELNILDV